MSDNTVTERRIRPIQDALEASNFKQALKECEKWQKKGEKSDRFLALKAAVLTYQSDLKSQEKGKTETLQLCRREPPIVNVDALHQLQNTLRHLSIETEEGPKMWERAIATRPMDRDLTMTWLTGSISVGSWVNAQKATMSLRKANPKDRIPEYWNILMCYLIHRDTKVSQKERILFGTLANRMISKAAQSTDPEKKISDPEELTLWAKVLINTGSSKDVAQLLQNGTLGAVTNQDSVVTLTLLLEALARSNSPEDIAGFCDKTLFSAEADENTFDDDRIWRLLVHAAQSLESQKTALEKIKTFVVSHPDCRAARLATLDLLAKLATAEEDGDELFQNCQSYYERFGRKAYCFDDLIHRLKRLSRDQMMSFRQRVSQEVSEPMNRMFALKLDYHILLTSDLDVSAIQLFTKQALEIYESIPKTTTACPEAALLASLALVHMAMKTSDQRYIFQACLILQTGSIAFPEYYPLSVLLLQLRKTIAQPSLAMKNFHQLSVKNLQWETIGHLLLTRISTLHPRRTEYEPLSFLDSALRVFENADRSLDRAIHEGLKEGSYSNIMDTVTVRRDLQYSMCRQLFAIEERKTQRVCGVPVLDCLDVQGGDLVDLRDTSFMPSYGLNQSPLETYLQCGPDPDHTWVHNMAKLDHLTTYLSSELGGYTAQAIEALTALKRERVYDAGDKDDMTTIEQQATQIANTLSDAIFLQLGGQPSQAVQFDSLLDQVQKWLETPLKEPDLVALDGLVIPSWEYLHVQYTILEMLQRVALFLGYQAKRAKTAKAKGITINRERIDKLQHLISAAEKTVHEQVRKVKEGLMAAGVLGRSVDIVLGRNMENPSQDYQAMIEKVEGLQNETAVEEFCGAMKDSWEDALDGILAVKVKIYK